MAIGHRNEIVRVEAASFQVPPVFFEVGGTAASAPAALPPRRRFPNSVSVTDHRLSHCYCPCGRTVTRGWSQRPARRKGTGWLRLRSGDAPMGGRGGSSRRRSRTHSPGRRAHAGLVLVRSYRVVYVAIGPRPSQLAGVADLWNRLQRAGSAMPWSRRTFWRASPRTGVPAGRPVGRLAFLSRVSFPFPMSALSSQPHQSICRRCSSGSAVPFSGMFLLIFVALVRLVSRRLWVATLSGPLSSAC